jgi:hypothetical protein
MYLEKERVEIPDNAQAAFLVSPNANASKKILRRRLDSFSLNGGRLLPLRRLIIRRGRLKRFARLDLDDGLRFRRFKVITLYSYSVISFTSLRG